MPLVMSVVEGCPAKTRRPRWEYQKGRAMRDRQEAIGVWRRDGEDYERSCAQGPVPLVMRSLSEPDACSAKYRAGGGGILESVIDCRVV